MRPPPFLKDSLVHFFAAGLALFLLLSALKPPNAPDRIIVDRAALLNFIQYRSKAFESNAAAAILDGMSKDERDQLVNDFIREEALYREAKALGLDEGDYVIRQRMVQKLEFMTEAATTLSPPDDAAVAAYYDANKEDYYEPPGATFAHVFISIDGKTAEETEQEAEAMLARLRADGARFEDATHYGDRFLFHTNYVERTYDYIKSQLGADATKTIFDSATPLSQWIGPVFSKYGAHLIFVTARTPGRVPALDEIKKTVAEDAARAARKKQVNALIDDIIKDYSPTVRLDEAASETGE